MSTNKISKLSLYGIMGGMLVSGTANTICMKYCDRGSAQGHKFSHPFYQCMTMFVGEIFCLYAHFIMEYRAKKKRERTGAEDEGIKDALARGQIVEWNRLWFALPASLDVLTSTLLFAGLLYTDAAVYQMMRGGIPLMVALVSFIFLKRKLYRHHMTGLFLLVVGLVMVGTESILDSGSEMSNAILGIIFLICSFVTCGIQFAIEEKLFTKFYVKPIEAVGMEGISGLTIYTFLLLFMYWIPVDQSNSGDVQMFVTEKLEDTPFALSQTFTSAQIGISLVGSILSIAFYNAFGLGVTKYASATARAVLDSARVLFVWFYDMGVWGKAFSLLMFFGFIILTFGTLLYNEILVIPWLGFNANTVDAIAKREQNQLKTLEGEEAINDSLIPGNPAKEEDLF